MLPYNFMSQSCCLEVEWSPVDFSILKSNFCKKS